MADDTGAFFKLCFFFLYKQLYELFIWISRRRRRGRRRSRSSRKKHWSLVCGSLFNLFTMYPKKVKSFFVVVVVSFVSGNNLTKKVILNDSNNWSLMILIRWWICSCGHLNVGISVRVKFLSVVLELCRRIDASGLMHLQNSEFMIFLNWGKCIIRK